MSINVVSQGMNMTGESRAAAAVIGVGLMFNVQASAPGSAAPEMLLPTPEVQDQVFPERVHDALVDARAEAVNYWTGRGIPTTLGDFVLLEGSATAPNACKRAVEGGFGEEYAPKPVINSGDDIPPHHCDRNDKIVVNPVGVQIGLGEEWAPDSKEAAILARTIIFHESGHHAQLKGGNYYRLSYDDVEFQAECYTGHMTAQNNPGDYRQIAEFYRNRTNGEEKLSHFTRGFNDPTPNAQACQNY